MACLACLIIQADCRQTSRWGFRVWDAGRAVHLPSQRISLRFWLSLSARSLCIGQLALAARGAAAAMRVVNLSCRAAEPALPAEGAQAVRPTRGSLPKIASLLFEVRFWLQRSCQSASIELRLTRWPSAARGRATGRLAGRPGREPSHHQPAQRAGLPQRAGGPGAQLAELPRQPHQQQLTVHGCRFWSSGRWWCLRRTSQLSWLTSPIGCGHTAPQQCRVLWAAAEAARLSETFGTPGAEQLLCSVSLSAVAAQACRAG